jgi:hypothetical protein
VLIGELEDAITQGLAAWAAKPSVEVKDGINDVSTTMYAIIYWGLLRYTVPPNGSTVVLSFLKKLLWVKW